MADFYTEMAAMTRGLLAPTSQGGLGQGEIVLTRKTPGTPGPNPWDPVEPVTQAETLRGAVRGVSQRLVGTEMGGTVILASDRQAICEVPQMQYQAGDTLTVDSVPVHIIAFERIPAAGTTSAVKFTIRG
ncbi:conserved hypothetical protein [Delftia acidovorans SPH-1]|uniref:Uncharacterized protein n=1 Tax=Delftia acidovorans (strain DSM 14801 / SPH-1) TaxID=398578 RepID=A9C0F6_DELAS|nr:hypothetical protein [Delftia acidovorans]ABX36722.1 conserved hypothetical protein [Delftia acidovorans SPH-1]QPS74027.1 hypothetical protein I6G48_25855 [Delftia acidovorans]